MPLIERLRQTQEAPKYVIPKCGATLVQERPLFKKHCFNPNFVSIIQERPILERVRQFMGLEMLSNVSYVH